MTKPRGRDLGLPFPGETGLNNAITDVPGDQGTQVRERGAAVEEPAAGGLPVFASPARGRRRLPTTSRYVDVLTPHVQRK